MKLLVHAISDEIIASIRQLAASLGLTLECGTGHVTLTGLLLNLCWAKAHIEAEIEATCSLAAA